MGIRREVQLAVDSSRATGQASPDGEGGVPAVRLAGVSKQFGEVTAVAGIDLEIADGEFFSMLGPSGSGKTTTLRMIAGFEEPTAGRIWLHGRDITGVPPFDRDINTVFQDYALFPHMSVADNVGYGLVVRKIAAGERRSNGSPMRSRWCDWPTTARDARHSSAAVSGSGWHSPARS